MHGLDTCSGPPQLSLSMLYCVKHDPLEGRGKCIHHSTPRVEMKVQPCHGVQPSVDAVTVDLMVTLARMGVT
eukprot:1607168-Rhodomonas_salina.2